MSDVKCYFYICTVFLGNIFELSRGYDFSGDILPNLQFSRNVDTEVLRRLVGLPVLGCVKECGLRTACSGINYERMVKMCELLTYTNLLPAERREGWVHMQVSDALQRNIMDTYCEAGAVCPAGTKCLKQNGGGHQCVIDECGAPPYTADQYYPKTGEDRRIGAKIRVQLDRSDTPFSAYCCPDGSWLPKCNVSLSTSTSASTSSTFAPSTQGPTSPKFTSSTPGSTSQATSTPAATSSTPAPSTTVSKSQSTVTSAATSTTRAPPTTVSKSQSTVTSAATSTTRAPPTTVSKSQSTVTSAATSTTRAPPTTVSKSQSTVTSAVTSTTRAPPTTVSKSQSTTTPAATSTSVSRVVITDNDWYLLPSQTRLRLLAIVTDVGLDWISAMTTCEDHGGSLAHLYDDLELSLVNDWLTTVPSVTASGNVWMGARFNNTEYKWSWERRGLKMQTVEQVLWGTSYPDLTYERYCVGLYVDIRGTNYLLNDQCIAHFGFICEKDYTNVTIDNGSWQTVNSNQLNRQVAYVNNPTLSWTRARDVCEKNGGILAHIYYIGELSDILFPMSISPEEKLWVGASFFPNGTMVWLNAILTDAQVDMNLLANYAMWDPNYSQCIWLSQQNWKEYYLGDSRCMQENSFLCQRALPEKIPDDDWLLLDDDVNNLRTVAYVQTPPLSWEEANNVCEYNNGRLANLLTLQESQIMIDNVKGKSVVPADQIWIGAWYEDTDSRWLWWSDKSIIDLSVTSAGPMDSDFGKCGILANDVNGSYVPLASICSEQKTYFCQRDYQGVVNDSNWFSIIDRKMTYFSQEAKWDTASVICEKNSGSLAHMIDRSEIDLVINELNALGIFPAEPLWLGGQYQFLASTWIWLEISAEIDASLFSPGFPFTTPARGSDDICIMLDGSNPSYYLLNEICTNKFRFICQKDSNSGSGTLSVSGLG